MGFTFNEESIKKFNDWKKKFPDDENGKMSLVIPALRLAQEQHGFIDNQIMEYVAEITNTPALHVYRVATFYTSFHKKPVGKKVLEFCTNVSCMLNGSEELFQKTCQHLGIQSGETTKDGRFTVEEVECLGACGEAPVVQSGDKYLLKMDWQKVAKELENS